MTAFYDFITAVKEAARIYRNLRQRRQRRNVAIENCPF